MCEGARPSVLSCVKMSDLNGHMTRKACKELEKQQLLASCTDCSVVLPYVNKRFIKPKKWDYTDSAIYKEKVGQQLCEKSCEEVSSDDDITIIEKDNMFKVEVVENIPLAAEISKRLSSWGRKSYAFKNCSFDGPKVNSSDLEETDQSTVDKTTADSQWNDFCNLLRASYNKHSSEAHKEALKSRFMDQLELGTSVLGKRSASMSFSSSDFNMLTDVDGYLNETEHTSLLVNPAPEPQHEPYVVLAPEPRPDPYVLAGINTWGKQPFGSVPNAMGKVPPASTSTSGSYDSMKALESMAARLEPTVPMETPDTSMGSMRKSGIGTPNSLSGDVVEQLLASVPDFECTAPGPVVRSSSFKVGAEPSVPVPQVFLDVITTCDEDEVTITEAKPEMADNMSDSGLVEDIMVSVSPSEEHSALDAGPASCVDEVNVEPPGNVVVSKVLPRVGIKSGYMAHLVRCGTSLTPMATVPVCPVTKPVPGVMKTIPVQGKSTSSQAKEMVPAPTGVKTRDYSRCHSIQTCSKPRSTVVKDVPSKCKSLLLHVAGKVPPVSSQLEVPATAQGKTAGTRDSPSPTVFWDESNSTGKHISNLAKKSTRTYDKGSSKPYSKPDGINNATKVSDKVAKKSASVKSNSKFKVVVHASPSPAPPVCASSSQIIKQVSSGSTEVPTSTDSSILMSCLRMNPFGKLNPQSLVSKNGNYAVIDMSPFMAGFGTGTELRDGVRAPGFRSVPIIVAQADGNLVLHELPNRYDTRLTPSQLVDEYASYGQEELLNPPTFNTKWHIFLGLSQRDKMKHLNDISSYRDREITWCLIEKCKALARSYQEKKDQHIFDLDPQPTSLKEAKTIMDDFGEREPLWLAMLDSQPLQVVKQMDAQNIAGGRRRWLLKMNGRVKLLVAKEALLKQAQGIQSR